MKKILAFAAATLLLMLNGANVCAYSRSMLSPALAHLSNEEVMIKSGLFSGDIRFSSKDFERAIGCSVDYITVTALPPADDGILTYKGTAVIPNQTLTFASLEELRFVPEKNCESSSFRFKSSGDYSMECKLLYTDSINLAPTVKIHGDSLAVWTQKDISTFGTLYASDPENDPLTFEITKYPAKGIVKLTDKANGSYIYTPCDGVTGEDSFTYTVRDSFGNYSDESAVIIDIDKRAGDIVFSDMEGHWAHNAAIVMAVAGAMDVKSENGLLCFDPDAEMTREDFLVTVMKALGAGEIEPCMTVFADNDKISEKSSGYVNRAYDLGVIKGVSENGMLMFKPDEKITRAEAAVILNSIIGAGEPDTIPVFLDNSAVPAWAKSSIYALTNEGIFKGTGEGNISPNAVLSRAQTAEILLCVKKTYGIK